jgi:sulfur carrier protein
MNLLINGEHRELPERATVMTAVDSAGAGRERSGLAVAVDGDVIPRGHWERTPLRDGQRVEVLQAVQGG